MCVCEEVEPEGIEPSSPPCEGGVLAIVRWSHVRNPGIEPEAPPWQGGRLNHYPNCAVLSWLNLKRPRESNASHRELQSRPITGWADHHVFEVESSDTGSRTRGFCLKGSDVHRYTIPERGGGGSSDAGNRTRSCSETVSNVCPLHHVGRRR